MKSSFSAILLLLLTSLTGYAEKLLISVNEFSPFVIKNEGLFTGFDIDLMNTIAGENGWSVEYVAEPTVLEAITSVESNRSDLAICGISITGKRYEKVSFSQPYFNSGLQLLVSKETFKNAVRLRDNWSVVSPILYECFVLLLIFLTVFAHSIWLVERGTGEMFSKNYFQGIGMAYWWSIVTCSTVGYGDVFPKSRLGRLVGGLIIILGIAWFGYFTANLTSIVTVIRQDNPPIKTIFDMKDKRVATERSTTASEFLSVAGINFSEVDNYEEACRMVSEGKMDGVLFDYPALLRYANANDDVVLVGGLATSEKYGIVMRKGSHLADVINLSLIKIVEDGRYNKMYEKWFGKDPLL
jgi:polar amino acid transport system substrate-binding protein